MPGTARHLLRFYRFPLVAWIAISFIVTRVQQAAYAAAHGQSVLSTEVLLGLPLSEFGRVAWDSGNFLTIAEFGYGKADWLAASFPGYPLVIRFVSMILGGNLSTGAVVASGAAGLCSALLFWKWMSIREVEASACRLGLLLYLLFPYSFVLYGVAYADGLLVCFVLAAFILAERDRFVLAGLAAAAATYTRPNGLALIPALAVFALQRGGALRAEDLTPDGVRAFVSVLKEHRIANLSRSRVSGLRPRHMAVGLSVVGVGVFAVQLARTHGNPFYFWTVQVDRYGHAPFTDIGTWLKWDFWQNPSQAAYNGLDVVNQVAATAITAVVVLFTPQVARRFGLGYAALAVSLVAILWVTAMWFAPAGRYLLPVLPIYFALWAERWEARPKLTIAVFGLSASGLLFLAQLFARTGVLNW